MENRKSIPIIALAIFSIVILLAHNNIERVYALSTYNINITADSGSMDYASGVDRYVVHHTGSNHFIFDSINPVTNVTTSLLFPVSAGKIYVGLACDANVCYTSQQIGTGSSSDRMLSFNPVTGAILVNQSYGITGFLQSENNEVKVFKGGWFSGVCSTATARVLKNIDGRQLGVCGGSNFGANTIGNIRQSSDGTVFAVTTSSTSGFTIWSATTFLQTCSAGAVTLGKTTPLEEYQNNFYVVVSTTTINKYSTTCVSGTGITGTGLTDQFLYLLKNTGRSEFYVISAGNVAVMNLTSTNISARLYSFAFDGSSTTNSQNSAVDAEHKQIAKANPGGSTLSIAQLDPIGGVGEGEEGQEVACFDINDSPEIVTLVCYTDEDGDGFPDLPGGVFGGLNPTRNVTSSAQFLAENLGLVEEGSDIRFNGVGYMIVAIGLGILISMFFLASKGDLNRIPTFVWFIGTLAVVGALTGFGFVDVTFFIIGILVIIALASAKILSTLELGGFR